MFIFQIQNHISNNIYLAGIRCSLDKLASHNPHWRYQMASAQVCPESEVHLMTFDVTHCNTTEEFLSCDVPNTPHALVLIKAAQKELLSSLVTHFNCSILCVDEVNFQMRELIETVVKNNRYLSAIATRHKTIVFPVEQAMLTRTECTILGYLGQGRSGVDISKALFRSEKTISTHKRSIMRKLKVTNDLELRKYIQGYESKRGLYN
ncbi:hypothetical protein GJV04_06790 [Enterobacteriaceae bacterium RIT714]|jgi:two-component system, NarL family, captular synthesis response regulator RcsB|uniref:helix-turn-helix transcriptional regulator n=1 Tax=Lelliottia sp. CFBP8978 TaxID=3096522 RepID=UPI0012ACF82C|nr:response regulator transcription factor [Lelliottia sp. CFBP8978]MDY1038737.1 LuxR C-terminal-related transcriptional regulator [Lelliottia sp. CFBP8978]MRS89742.1 hypothetical protein [Enterobacteriaceae bacterium RIT714]